VRLEDKVLKLATVLSAEKCVPLNLCKRFLVMKACIVALKILAFITYC
jgi:hypothetical protein